MNWQGTEGSREIGNSTQDSSCKAQHSTGNSAQCSVMTYVGTCMLSCFAHVWFSVTLWIVARQALLSMGCFRQEYWSGLPFPSPGDLLNPRVEPASLISPALAGEFFITRVTWEVQPKWEGNPKMRVYMYTYCWFTAVCWKLTIL